MWIMTRSASAVVAALIVGVFIDLDHVPDYYRWLIQGKTDRVTFFAHSYEFIVPALVVSYFSEWSPIAVAATIAFIVHVVSDQIFNPVAPLTYFLTYRIFKRFRREALIRSSVEDGYEQVTTIPIVGRYIKKFIHAMRKEPLPWQ